MSNPMIKIEMKKEGRNLRLPVAIIFYNAILSFTLILFMLFNSEVFQEGYLYHTSLYQYQFIIISAVQVLTVIFLIPITVRNIYSADKNRNMAEQFMIIPDANRHIIVARILLVLMVYSLLFVSGMPLIGICSLYTATSWVMILRLYLVVLVISFWCGAIAIFFYSVCKNQVSAFTGIVLTECGFFIGTILLAELMRFASISMSSDATVPAHVSIICMIVLILNPLTAFLNFYTSLTANLGITTAFFEQLGINVASKSFSIGYYRCSYAACIIVGIIFLTVSYRKCGWNILKKTS